MSGGKKAKRILRKEIWNDMNRRQLKKATKKKIADAIVNQNIFLKDENMRLKRRIKLLEEKEEAIARGYEANVGTLTRLFGDSIDGCSVIEVPIEEIGRTKLEYEVKVAIENDKYRILALPTVDPETTE